MKLLLIPFLLAAAAHAAVGPKYEPPKIETPAQYREGQGGTGDLRRWWTVFHDPALESLIERAQRSNFDLRLAETRLAEVRAARGVSRAGLLPSVNTSAATYRSRGALVLPGQQRSSILSATETGIFQAGFDASWEIDLFGGQRRALEAATGDVRAADEARRDMMVTVAAEVARNYAELRGLQKRLGIARKNIDIEQRTLDLTRVRAKAGLGTELDAERASAQLDTTQAAVPALESQIRQAIHRLSVLIGQEPNALAEELGKAAPIPAAPPAVPAGLPSELLLRRPDLRRSEAELAAATARIGVARADLFPRIFLTGTAGRQSTDFTSLSLGLGNYFSFGPSVKLPLFSGGRIRSNIQISEARQQQALLRYQQAVLNALADVESALVAAAQERDRYSRLSDAAQSSQTSVDLASELYTRGLSDFLSVLDTQRSLYAVEDQQVQSEQAVVLNVIALYKALGGGWE